jgi:hypothetical protein
MSLGALSVDTLGHSHKLVRTFFPRQPTHKSYERGVQRNAQGHAEPFTASVRGEDTNIDSIRNEGEVFGQDAQSQCLGVGFLADDDQMSVSHPADA